MYKKLLLCLFIASFICCVSYSCENILDISSIENSTENTKNQSHFADPLTEQLITRSKALCKKYREQIIEHKKQNEKSIANFKQIYENYTQKISELEKQLAAEAESDIKEELNNYLASLKNAQQNINNVLEICNKGSNV